MKVKVNKKAVHETAAKAAKVITKSIMPVLECLHMEVEGDKITFSAYSNEMMISTSCREAVSDENFSCIFAADMFLRFLSKVKSEDIVMTLVSEKKQKTLYLNGGQAKMKLLCLEESWPQIEKITDPDFKAETDFLLPAIMQTKHALIEGEVADPMRKSFCISQKDDSWKITALDGSRISIRYVGENFEEPDREIILNGSSLTTLSSIFDGTVELVLKGDGVNISDERTFVCLRTVAGKYFNISSILNHQTSYYIDVDNLELQDALSLVTGLSVREREKKIKMTVTQDNLLIESNDSIGNELKCNLEVTSNFEKEFIAGMNPHFLLDAIKSIGEEKIRIHVKNNVSPFSIKGENYHEILLPIRIV